MLTRAEELQNLREMKKRIDSINSFEERIGTAKSNIEQQKQRSIKEDFPEYVPSDYYEKAKKTTGKLSLIISAILIFIEIGWGIVVTIYFCNTDQLVGWLQVVFFLALYYVPFVVAFPFGLLAHLVFALLGIYRTVFYISFGLVVVFFILCCLDGNKASLTKNDKKKLEEAKRKDEEHKRAYESQKKEYQAHIKSETKKLQADIERKIAEYNERIMENQALIKEEIAILKSIPGLADQDKNEYTVNKLITYFERGKADSIKEAINLFDAEERENERDRLKREQQSSWYRIMLEEQMRAERERKELIEKQSEENQRRYNELKRIENERNEKVDDFIREVKRKLDE